MHDVTNLTWPDIIPGTALGVHVTPDLKTELTNAIIGALDAHNAMSNQALASETVRDGLRDVLLNYAGLYEALRARAAMADVPS